ncbi:MAG: biotin/lipoyl-binding protein [Chloroflexi bacterium]|nr:biotin/lipoyl-binding protein [Chloroflexota bacterium]
MANRRAALRWSIILIVAGLAAGLLAGCEGLAPGEVTPTPIPTAVVPTNPVFKVQRGQVAEEVRFTGRTAPVREEQLFFRMDGRVARVTIRQGDRVKQGDLLAELEIGDLLNQLAQARVNRQQIRIRLENAEAVLVEQRTQAAIALETAKLRLAQARARDPDRSVEIAAANRDKAAAALRLAQAAHNGRPFSEWSVEDAVAEQRTQSEVALETAKLRLAQARARDPDRSVAIAAANRDKAAAALRLAQAAYDIRAQRPGVAGSAEALNLEQATLNHEIARRQYEQALESKEAAKHELQILEQGVRLAELAARRPGASNLPEALNPEQATLNHEIARRQYEQALESREAAKYELQILEQGVRLAELNWGKAGSVDPALTQEVQKAQLAVERLEALAANARLVAPYDGEVVMMGVRPGQGATAYRPAISVAAPGAVEVSADVKTESLPKLGLGQTAAISLADRPGREYRGRIRQLPYPHSGGGTISEAAKEEDRATRVSIDDADEGIEKGLPVQVRVLLQQKDDVLWLPAVAVRTYQGKDFLVVQEGELQRRVPVKVGLRGEERMEIMSGVDEGQEVVGP